MNPREAITKRVHALLERETRINLHRHPIEIGNADGVVTLEGEVGDIAAKKLAFELAASAGGVRGVVDRVRVDPGVRRGDGAIRDALARILLEQRELLNCALRWRGNGKSEVYRERSGGDSAGEIEFSVSDGIIALEGHVISQPHRLYAGVLGWWTPGRRDVVNALEVRPGYEDRDDEVTEALRLVLEADPQLDADGIVPRCRRWVVTLKGYVPTEKQKRWADLDAWYLSGVDRVVNELQVID